VTSKNNSTKKKNRVQVRLSSQMIVILSSIFHFVLFANKKKRDDCRL